MFFSEVLKKFSHKVSGLSYVYEDAQQILLFPDHCGFWLIGEELL